LNYAGKFGADVMGPQQSNAHFDFDSVSHGGHVATVTIPDAHLLFSGDFERSGVDLIVSDHLHRVVVPNYFQGNNRPTLVSPEGALLDSAVIETLTGHVAYAQAAATSPGAKVVGHVVKMTGSASIVRNGVTIDVNNGDTVYQSDVVQTGSGSTLGLVLIDGTTFNLTANARLMLNELTYDPSGTSNTSLLSLVEGAASFVAGQVAKTGDMKVGTPVAIIGIRGTAVILDISSADGKVDISVVDQQDGQVHAVQVFKCVPTGLPGAACTAGDSIGTVTSNGPSLSLTPTANLQVIAQENSKTAAQVGQEFNAFQQVLSTYDTGKQLVPNTPPPSDGRRGDANPQSTTKFAAGSSTPPIESTNTPLITTVANSAQHLVAAIETTVIVTVSSSVSVNPTQSLSLLQIPIIQAPPTTVAITSPVTAGDVINQSEVSAGFIISGTATAGNAPVNGQIATISIVDSSNVVKYTYTTTVTNGSWSVNVTAAQAQALADGSYSIQATVSDAAGNAAITVTQTITVDTVPPTVTISTPDTTTNQSTQTISGSVTTTEATAGATVTLYDTVNGVTTQIGTATVGSGGTWSTSVTLSGSGSHSIVAQDTNAAGNTGTSTPVVFTLDTLAPTVMISTTAETSNVATQTISGTVAAGEAAVGATVTLLDTVGGVTTQIGTATVGSGGVWSTSVTLSGDGAHSVVAKDTDVAGNTGTSAPVVFTLDTTVPTGGTPALTPASDSGSSHTDNITNVTNPTFTIALNPTVAVGDAVQLLLGGSPLAHPVVYTVTSTDIANGGVSLTVVAGDLGSDGSKSITAQFTDVAGNTSTTSADVITLDTTAPTVTTLTDVTSNGSDLDAGQTVTFTLAASEALTIATGAALTLSNGATAAYNSSTGKFVYTVAADHDTSDLNVTGYSGSITDAAGNALVASGVALDTHVQIDTTAPTVTIGNTGGNTNQSAPTISGTVDIGDVGATVNIYDNGGATPVATTTVQSDGTWSKSVTLVSGTNSLTAQVTDGAGNTGTSNTVIFTLNAVGPTGGTPVLAPSSDSGVSNSDDITNVTAPTFTVALNTSTVVVGDTVQLLLGGLPLAHPVVHTVTSTDITNGSVSLTVTTGDLGSDESKSISAQLSDSFGNSNTTAALAITLDTTAPSAPTVSHLADAANSSFDAGFTVATGAAVTVTVNGTALTSVQLAADFTKSTAGGLDTYTAKGNAFTGTEAIAVSATLTDAAGNTSSAGTLTLNPVDTTAPSAPAVSHLADAANSSFDAGFTVTAGAAVTVTVNGTALTSVQLAADFTKSTAGGLDTYTAKGNAFTGTETIAVSATLTDAAGNTSSAGTLTLNPLDTTAPTVTIGNAGGNTNQSAPTISGTVDIGDVGATVNIYDNGGATPVATTTVQSDGTWSKSVTLVSGTNSLTAQVTDGAGNTGTSTPVVFTLSTTGPTVTESLALDTGSSASDKITSNDALTGSGLANTVVHFTIDGSLIATTVTTDALGAWSFTPTGLVDGAHTIVVSQTDAFSNIGTAALSFTLDTAVAAPSAPDMTVATDSGSSSTDNITNVTTPTFTGGGAEAGATVTLLDTNGTTVLGTATADGSGNWSITSPTLSSGSHTLTAKQTDIAGNTSAASGSLAVTIDTTAPAMSITTTGGPTNQAAQTISGTVDVADIGTTVSLFDNGSATALGTAIVGSGGLWSTSVTLSGNGTHSIVAKDTDTAGNTGTSTPVVFTLSTTGPTVTESLAFDTGSSASDNITSNDALTGTGLANTAVDFTIDGSLIATAVTTDALGAWSFTPTGLADGAHTIVASQTDAFSNIGTAALSFTLDTAVAAPSAPDMTVATDSGSSSTDNITNVTTPTFTGGGAEAGATVTLFDTNGTTVLGTATADGSGNWSITSSTLSSGSHTLTAKQTDIAGNTSVASAGLSVVIDTTAAAPSAPDMTVATDSGLSSTDNITNNTTPVFTGSGAEAGATVTLFDTNGTTVLGSATADGSGNWSITSSALSSGSHTLTAKQTDLAGNTSVASASQAVTIDTTAAAPSAPDMTAATDSGLSSTDNITNNTTPVFTGSGAEAGATMTLFDTNGTTVLGTATADGSGNWSITSSTLSSGSHTLTVKQTDLAGNTSAASASLAVTIDTTAPAMSITTMAARRRSAPRSSAAAACGAPALRCRAMAPTVS
jgi:hypothetical protein